MNEGLLIKIKFLEECLSNFDVSLQIYREKQPSEKKKSGSKNWLTTSKDSEL